MEDQEDQDYQDYRESYEKYRTLEGLKKYFESRFLKSQDKETFLKREIEGYELVFDDERLPLSYDYEEVCPLSYYSIELEDWEIILIRDAYSYFIVNGNALIEAEGWTKKMNVLLSMKITNFTYGIDLAKTMNEYRVWLKKFPNENNIPIIKVEYLGLIFDHFKECFDQESKERWISRFCYPSFNRIEPIYISKEAKEGSDKLVLIAILAAIQTLTGNKFDYNKFVFSRFGIKAFEKIKSAHKKKETYREALKKCNEILKK